MPTPVELVFCRSGKTLHLSLLILAKERLPLFEEKNNCQKKNTMAGFNTVMTVGKNNLKKGKKERLYRLKLTCI